MLSGQIFINRRREWSKEFLEPGHRISLLCVRVMGITDILSQNVPLEDVQYLAGHTDPRATLIYDRR